MEDAPSTTITREVRRLACATIALILAFALSPIGPSQAFAEGSAEVGSLQAGIVSKVVTQATKNASQMGIKFDLKNNKFVTNSAMMRGAGRVKFKQKISNLKVEDSGDGYKKATFRYTSQLKSAPTKSQRVKFFKTLAKYDYDWASVFGDTCITFMDYFTGKDVGSKKKSRGVKIEKAVVADVPTKTYVNSKTGAWFRLGKKYVVDYTIRFKNTYDGLAMGLGSAVVCASDETKVDKTWSSDTGSKYAFYKTSLYKKGKEGLHFIRIK